MLRLLVLTLLAVLIYLLIRAAVAGFLAGFRGSARAVGSRALRNELVKDPVCETYVPRRTAIARSDGAVTHYFCSPACAAKFQGRA